MVGNSQLVLQTSFNANRKVNPPEKKKQYKGPGYPRKVLVPRSRGPMMLRWLFEGM